MLTTTTTTTTTTTKSTIRHRGARARSTGRVGGATVVRRAGGSEDEELARDSSAYRGVARGDAESGGLLGKIVANLPDGRRETAPESYGSRPESKTLKEGRYARGDPIRSGAVREDTIRGEDFEVVESGLPGIGALVTLAIGGAVLFGVYKVVTLLDEPVAPRAGSARMPASEKPELARVSRGEPVAALQAPAVDVAES